MASPYAEWGKIVCGYDAALWNCRFEIAATPRNDLAQLRHSRLMRTLAFSVRGVARAEQKRKIPSAGVVATTENAKFCVCEASANLIPNPQYPIPKSATLLRPSLRFCYNSQ